eukprot:TRINITY_DN16043_c0_g1_i1.p1 TRINITY_DN16043_c0_g1~~TRINITY_DN16043_c0_g1_i1.p1  ORF type:complete len:115 (+),score=24.52 TRINITY_DN16043_c0_g1_i1:43-345(+)
MCIRDSVNPNSGRYRILSAFQRLFSEMQGLDVRSVSSEQLTKSFGWEGKQEMQQQDVQEAYRYAFPLERALSDTPLAKEIPDLFKGMLCLLYTSPSPRDS